jgi:hypothetical protein
LLPQSALCWQLLWFGQEPIPSKLAQLCPPSGSVTQKHHLPPPQVALAHGPGHMSFSARQVAVRQPQSGVHSSPGAQQTVSWPE